jgi:DNA-binding transcriptional regulator LsrR (DeoR family)
MKKRANKKKTRNKIGNPAASSVSSKPQVRWRELDRTEQLSVICSYFCRGIRVSEIAKQVSSKFGTQLTREAVYPIIAEAARRGWIRYVPPPEHVLERRLKELHRWLTGCQVVHTSTFDDIAYSGAEMLIGLMRDFKHQGKEEVHVGFAGGHAMRKLAQTLATLVRQFDAELPKKVVLHAFVASFNVYEPITDPNTFFTLFMSNTPTGTNFEFVGLYAPPVVNWDQFASLRNIEGVKESFQRASDIDIVVTSAANLSDEHSTFRKYMQNSGESFALLESAGCVGDMLWLPVGKNKPVDAKTTIRAMTLMGLNQLHSFIKKGKYVLLVLGPCAACNRTKSEILGAILNQRNNLITHLVADSRSVGEMLRGM